MMIIYASFDRQALGVFALCYLLAFHNRKSAPVSRNNNNTMQIHYTNPVA